MYPIDFKITAEFLKYSIVNHQLENLYPFRNGRFCSKTRPQAFFDHRRSQTTSRIEKSRERSIGAKDAISKWILAERGFRRRLLKQTALNHGHNLTRVEAFQMNGS